jgi:hypothetical protein
MTLKREDRIAFRYANAAGEITAEANPNGSLDNIAGVLSEGRNVLGMMPHPDRSSEALLGSADGLLLFQSMARSLATAADAAKHNHYRDARKPPDLKDAFAGAPDLGHSNARWYSCVAMVDIHHHLLPGLDDGANSMETSVEMARLAVARGLRTWSARRTRTAVRVRPLGQRGQDRRVARAAGRAEHPADAGQRMRLSPLLRQREAGAGRPGAIQHQRAGLPAGGGAGLWPSAGADRDLLRHCSSPA